ncbi:unnamed protein product [Choristocarpus tenellus]
MSKPPPLQRSSSDLPGKSVNTPLPSEDKKSELPRESSTSNKIRTPGRGDNRMAIRQRSLVDDLKQVRDKTSPHGNLDNTIRQERASPLRPVIDYGNNNLKKIQSSLSCDPLKGKKPLPWETIKSGLPWESTSTSNQPSPRSEGNRGVTPVKKPEGGQDINFARGNLDRMIGGGSYGGEQIIDEREYQEMSSRRRRRKKAEYGPANKEVRLPTVPVTVMELASIMSLKVDVVLRSLRNLGEWVTVHSEVDPSTAEVLAYDLNLQVQHSTTRTKDIQRTNLLEQSFEDMPSRPPVVSVMGHVDHGKTTLLDKFRSSNVAHTEAAGITQKIGAFVVDVKDSSVTFFDTPGHAAFKAMRRSASRLTDLVVVVVAADDGIRPQTVEVLEMLKELPNLETLVAVTKIDRHGVNAKEAVERISNQLLEHGVVVEAFGGETPIVPVSAVSGEGLDNLLEALLLQAEIMELRADSQAAGEGVVVDSSVERGLGCVTDVLVSWGKVKVGDIVVAGLEQGKVKMLKNSNGKSVKEASAAQPVRVIGFKGLPKMGDEMLVVPSEEKAQQVIALRERDGDVQKLSVQEKAYGIQQAREAVEVETQKAAQQAFLRRMSAVRRANEARKNADSKSEGALEAAAVVARAAAHEKLESEKLDVKMSSIGVHNSTPLLCNAIFKADGYGSLAAMDQVMEDVPSDEVSLKVLRADVGPVTRSDVDLAVTAEGASIFAFNVNVSAANVKAYAQQQNVQIHSHDVIYRFEEDARSVMSAMLPLQKEDVLVGAAEVLQLFDTVSKGNQRNVVAGCNVTQGKLKRSETFRVLRGGKILFDGDRAKSMRRFKDKVNEVANGKECGLSLNSFNDYEVGDIIECYSVKEVRRTL